MLSPAPFLSVRGITKSFGPVRVLHGVDLDLAPGTVTALLGENGAGKSTFVRILAGDHMPDGGRIAIDGRTAVIRSVRQAREAGIRLIAQEIADAPTLSVAENITLGHPPARWGFVDRQAQRALARDALRSLGAEIPLETTASQLRLGERQIIEIARATIGESRCLIFDEPTAALSDAETRRLFDLIARMKARGLAILYITHRLDEVFEIADRVCVLRDGQVSMDAAVTAVDTAAVVTAMVGREVATAGAGSDQAPLGTRPILEVEGLSGQGFSDISLSVARGEILGLYGKIGSGVPELAATLFGALPPSAGAVRVDGKTVRFAHPADAVRQGIGFLPADRKSEGLLAVRSAAENLAAPSWGRLARWGTIGRRTEVTAFRRWHEALRIRASADGREQINRLSGGNQQKVLLGRWLEARARLLLLVEPTRGVDIGARQDIHEVLRRMAREGHGILIASSDHEDITHLASRALVMVRGRIEARLTRATITVASLTEAAGGGRHV